MTVVNEWIHEAPYSEDPVLREAYHSFLREDFDLAIRLLTQLSDTRRGNTALRNDLAVCLYLAGDKHRSREILLQAAGDRRYIRPNTTANPNWNSGPL